MLILAIAVFVIGMVLEIDGEILPFLSAAPVIPAGFFFTREERPRIYGEIVIEKGKSYDLSWRVFGGNKFKVRER